MNKIILLALALSLTSCQENKVGFVDYAELMNQYEAKKTLEASFQQKAQKFARTRDSISQMFQIEAQGFQQRAQSMNPNKAQEEYANLQTRGQQIGQQLQMEEQLIQEEGSQKMDSLLKSVRLKISEYGKNNGYNYILAGGEGGTVLYGSDSQDLTQKVLSFLQETNKE
jgi:outer membrane protein